VHEEDVTNAAITQRHDEQEKRLVAVERKRDEYKQLYVALMARCRKLEMGLLGSKAERCPPTLSFRSVCCR
jgi:hypothetical protein